MTIDSSVRYSPQGEQTQSISKKRDSEPNAIKNNSRPRKRKKTFTKIKKKFAKMSAEGFKNNEGTMNYYF